MTRGLSLLFLVALGCEKDKPATQTQAMAATSATPPPSLAAPVVSAPSAPSPMSAAQRALAVVGLQDLRAFVKERASTIRVESDQACEAHRDRDSTRKSSGLQKLGPLADKRTRFSTRPPNLGQTVSAAVAACVDGCLLENAADPDDDSGKQMIASSCQNALVVLDDLEADLKTKM